MNDANRGAYHTLGMITEPYGNEMTFVDVVIDLQGNAVGVTVRDMTTKTY